jgi:predicted RNA-binding Zn ribbon-like protein
MTGTVRAGDTGRTAAPFQFIAGNLALDFVNTVGSRLHQPHDYLPSWSEAQRWARAAGLEAPPGSAGGGARELSRLRRLRQELYMLLAPLAAPPHRCAPGALARLNRRLAELPARRLAWREGRAAWQWARSTPWQRLQAALVLSAAELLASSDAAAVRQCQDARCGWLFLDHSQAGRRRWCSMAECGNRAKARRHQQRAG